MKKLILCILLLIIATTASNAIKGNTLTIQATHIKPQSLSIDKAVEEAMRRKPSIQAHQYSITDYKRQQKATFSTYLPNVSLSEKFYNTKNASMAKSAFGLQASQTVLNLAQQNYTKLYGAYISSARHQKASHEDEIHFATETAFLSAWLLQQKITLITLLFNSSKQIFEKEKHQHKVDLLNKNDWLTANATHSSNLATVNSYKDEISQTQKTLEYYTGLQLALLPNKQKKEPTLLSWEPTEKHELRSFDYYYQAALKNRKDLKIKQDSIDAESHTSQYYATKYVPSVSLFGSATKYTSRANNSTTSKEAGVQLSWNVFDGLSNYFNKSAADARKMKARLEKNDTVLKVKLDVQTAYSTLQKEMKNLEAQTISYQQSRNEFDIKKQQLELGLISIVEFETAQYIWELGRYTWMSQATTTALKHQELLYSCGYPSEFTQLFKV